jgi:general secretion pathway protein N
MEEHQMSKLLIIAAAPAILVACLSLAFAATTTFEPLPSDDVAARHQLGAAPSPAAAVDAPVSANPLWGIPLATLTATRARPIFLPSRRPQAPAVAAAPPPAAQPAPPPEPEKPALQLVGVVSGADEGFAIFIDSTTRDVVRLKTGEGHKGWILTSVSSREVTLERGERSAIIALPTPTQERK